MGRAREDEEAFEVLADEQEAKEDARAESINIANGHEDPSLTTRHLTLQKNTKKFQPAKSFGRGAF